MSEYWQQGAQRIYFTGRIRINAPLHIGSGETVARPGRADTDSPIKLDPAGKPYIPATSIGGLLRGTAENLTTVLEGWSLEDVRQLFGAERETGAVRRSKPKINRPSRLRIRDSALIGGWEQESTVRDGVGIDRQRNAARAHVLYNYEVVPAGREFGLWFELRDGETRDQELLALTLEALTQLPASVGARGGSGVGAIEFEIDGIFFVNLTEKQTLLKFLRQGAKFNFTIDANKQWDWDKWREEHLPQPEDIRLKSTAQPYWRVPQAVTFTYHIQVKDPLLIRGREAPESAFEDYEKRSKQATSVRQKELSVGEESKRIDAAWIGKGRNPSDDATWEPVIPGASLRGVFRSHCERILRTLWWHQIGETQYKRTVKTIASDPLAQDGYLKSSGFDMEADIGKLWREKLRGDGDELTKRYNAGQEIAQEVWRRSDFAERMWGSSQWRSRVQVSEAVIPDDEKGTWGELLFQNVAINRFTGGASDQKLFNALAVTHATFEGSVTVFGDELWMIGLVALLFKDLTDGLIRAGSGKTRGRGLFEGWLEKIEVKALPESEVWKACQASPAVEERIWGTWRMEKEKLAQFPEVDGWLKTLLEKGVAALNKMVKASGEREADSEHHHSS